MINNNYYRPVVAIIGRPNVGKSSLFNRLLKQRQAIVSPISGTTRDRLYATLPMGDFMIDLIDTAGLDQDLGAQQYGSEMLTQIQEAVSEADILIFVLDAHAGLTAQDQQLAEIIRKAGTSTIVFINKDDSPLLPVDEKLKKTGLGPTLSGSITQRRGVAELRTCLEELVATLMKEQPAPEQDDPSSMTGSAVNLPSVAIAGRPNVGKSSLFNALVGYERVIVSDIPGTTRDAINTKVSLSDGTEFLIVDTAGLRRRGKIGQADKIERYSVIRTLRAIDQSDIVLLVADGLEGLTRGDVHVAMYALEQKKRLITVINKIDLIDPKTVNWRRFPFLARLPIVFISALTQENISELLEQVSQSLHTLDEKPDQISAEEKQPPKLGQ